MTDKRNFENQFGDFDPATLPAIPAEWEDISWGNDACPSWSITDVQGDEWWNLTVFIDYADLSLRELPGGKRFNLLFSHHTRDHSPESVLSTDDWDEVLAFATAFDPAKALESEQPEVQPEPVITVPDGDATKGYTDCTELLAMPVTNRPEAEAFIDKLFALKLGHHFDDGAIECLFGNELVSLDDATAIEAKVAACYEAWEASGADLQHDCPIGHLLDLMKAAEAE